MGSDCPARKRVRTVSAVVCDRGMAIALATPGVDGLSASVGMLREWQYDEAPMQLHPGDVGWFWRVVAVQVKGFGFWFQESM